MSDETLILHDYTGRLIRLTQERLTHVLDHPEMADQLERIQTTLAAPALVVATEADSTVQVYHRWFTTTPVGDKYLLVAVKLMETDAFLLTAFFSSRPKKGTQVWPT